MLRQVMTGAALLLVGSAASAADLQNSGIAPGQWFDSPSGSVAAVSITQNNDTGVIDALASVACVGAGTTQNPYLRRFFLNTDHGIVDQFTVQSVDFGTEECTAAVIAAVNIYSIAAGDAFTYANLTLEDTAPVELSPADVGLFTNVPVGGVFPDPVGSDLVMEVSVPDLSALGAFYFIGSNFAGATRDAYIATVDCGISDPIAVSDIGFPDAQFIMVVNGDEAGTVPTEDATWSEVKSLF